MTLEQVVLTMINDKMLDNGQISEKLAQQYPERHYNLEYIQYSSREEVENRWTVQMNIASESVDWKGIRWIFMQHVRN